MESRHLNQSHHTQSIYRASYRQTLNVHLCPLSSTVSKDFSLVADTRRQKRHRELRMKRVYVRAGCVLECVHTSVMLSRLTTCVQPEMKLSR